MIKTFIIGVLLALCVAFALKVKQYQDYIRDNPRKIVKTIRVYSQKCPGCGNEFWCEPTDGKLPKPIEAPCPFCQMSEEEFDEWQEQLRRERDGKP